MNAPTEIECSTAAEAEAAIRDGNTPLLIASMRLEISVKAKIKCMSGIVTIIALGSAIVTAESWGSSQLSAESWGSSQLSAVSRESSKLSAVSWGSSKLSAVSWGSSKLSAVSRESSQLSAESRESSKLSAESWGSSKLSAESWGSSKLSAVSWGSSKLSAVSWGSSKLSAESWGSSQLSAESWGSSQLSAVSRESSQLSAVSWGSSKLSAVSRESSQLSAVSRESSKLSAESYGVTQISVRGPVQLTAGKQVAIVAFDRKSTIEGGGFVAYVDISTPLAWCEYYGVAIEGDCAVLFKALDSEFKANHNGFKYEPGTTQKAPDWDPNPARECGGGLHFSPTPRHAQKFHPSATKFVGVLVPLASLLVHPDGESPDKCRGPETRGCWEVDIDGKRIQQPEAAE